MTAFPFAPLPTWADGGYPFAALVDDGELLCPACVNDADNPVHSGGDADGWRIETITVLDADDLDAPCYCAHCNRQF